MCFCLPQSVLQTEPTGSGRFSLSFFLDGLGCGWTGVEPTSRYYPCRRLPRPYLPSDGRKPQPATWMGIRECAIESGGCRIHRWVRRGVFPSPAFFFFFFFAFPKSLTRSPKGLCMYQPFRPPAPPISLHTQIQYLFMLRRGYYCPHTTYVQYCTYPLRALYGMWLTRMT